MTRHRPRTTPPAACFVALAGLAALPACQALPFGTKRTGEQASAASAPAAPARRSGPPVKAQIWTPPPKPETAETTKTPEREIAGQAVPVATDDPAPVLTGRPDELAFPIGPVAETYVADGKAITRQISGPHESRGWWAEDDTTRSLILSRADDGTRMHFLTADGRSGPVEYAFDPPLVIMPATLSVGVPFEQSATIRYGSPDRQSSEWDDGTATSTIELLDDGRVRTTLVLQTGRSSATRTTTRTLRDDAGIVREVRSLRVVAFGMTVRKSDTTLERADSVER